MTHRRKVGAVLMLAAVMVGCYAYRPTAATGLPPGKEIRLELTDAGTVAVTPVVGPRVVAIGGRLVAAEDTAYTIALTTTTQRNGAEEPWKGERMVVRRDLVASVAERSFSKRKTFMAAGVYVALGALFYKLLEGDGPPGGLRQGEPEPPK